jgi:hypothetical protein
MKAPKNLGKIQKILLAIGDMTSSAYSTVFAIVLFISIFRTGDFTGVTDNPTRSPTHAPTSLNQSTFQTSNVTFPTSFPTSSPTTEDPLFTDAAQQALLYYYLLLWVLVEGLNLLSIWTQRIVSIFYKLQPSQVKKYFVFRFFSLLHNFFMIICTGGFLGEWVGGYSDFIYMDQLRWNLMILQFELWILVIVMILGGICLLGLTDSDVKVSCIAPCCVMLSMGFVVAMKRITRTLCNDCFASIFNCVLSPATIAIYLLLIPASFLVFVLFTGLHTVAWGLVVGTLGIPILICWLFLPSSYFKLISDTRKQFYRNTRLQYYPAIFSFLRMLDLPQLVQEAATLGICFDCIIISVVLYIVFGLGSCAIAGTIIVDVYPMSLQSVGNDIIDSHSSVTQLWILSKVVQVVVALAIPLLRLYANGKLKRLKKLLKDYPTLVLQRVIFLLLEFLINHTDIGSSNEANELRRQVAEIGVIIDQLTSAVEQEILDISELLFDFDFEHSSGTGSAKAFLNPIHEEL